MGAKGKERKRKQLIWDENLRWRGWGKKKPYLKEIRGNETRTKQRILPFADHLSCQVREKRKKIAKSNVSKSSIQRTEEAEIVCWLERGVWNSSSSNKGLGKRKRHVGGSDRRQISLKNPLQEWEKVQKTCKTFRRRGELQYPKFLMQTGKRSLEEGRE